MTDNKVYIRYCRTCKFWKPESEFKNDKRAASGLSNFCKECIKNKTKNKHQTTKRSKKRKLSEEDRQKARIIRYEKLGKFYSN